MKSISHGTLIARIRSAMKNTAPFSTPTSSSSRPSYSAEISRPSSRIRSCRRSSSMRISPTPRSTSVCDTVRSHPLGLDDAGHRDDLVAAHDKRPALTIGARNLRVDEHVLHLLRAPLEAIAGPPSPYLKPWEVGLDPPPPPRDRAVQLDRRGFEPEPLVLPHRLHAAAEVDPLRADRRVE